MRLALFLFSLSFSLFAQTRYSLRGFYSQPGQTSPTPYALNWAESGETIKGLYKDNSISESIQVEIIKKDRMRIFQIPLSRQVTLMTTLPADNSHPKNVPVSVTLEDSDKNLVAASLVEADFSATQAQAQEDRVSSLSSATSRTCVEGFGGLAGYCGTYEGLVVEEQDTANKCALTSQIIPRLFLNENGELGVRVGAVSTLNPNPVHKIGRIPLNDSRARVDLMSRVCRPLDGTSFNGDDCKRINVTGDFSQNQSNTAHFFGTYVIVDEKTNERCQYRFSLDRNNS